MERNFIRLYDDILSPEDCKYIIERFEFVRENSYESHVREGQKDNEGATNRVDQAIFFNSCGEVKATQMINDAIKKAWGMYVQEIPYLSDIMVGSFDVKVQRTPEGGGFHTWHWEHGVQDHACRNRMAVWTVYLTDHEDEGSTEFLAHGTHIYPKAGSIAVFPADYTAMHRGNPVYKKPKYIATGWYLYAAGV